jgi:hypothetical protein
MAGVIEGIYLIAAHVLSSIGHLSQHQHIQDRIKKAHATCRVCDVHRLDKPNPFTGCCTQNSRQTLNEIQTEELFVSTHKDIKTK